MVTVVQTKNAHITMTWKSFWPVMVWVLLVTMEKSTNYFPEAVTDLAPALGLVCFFGSADLVTIILMV